MAGRSYCFSIPPGSNVAQAVLKTQLAFQAHISAKAEVVALAGDSLVDRFFRHGGDKFGLPGLLGQTRQQGR